MFTIVHIHCTMYIHDPYILDSVLPKDIISRSILIKELKKYHREDIMVIVGGVIPPQDYQFLFDSGAVAVYGPGTKISEAAIDLLQILIDSVN